MWSPPKHSDLAATWGLRAPRSPARERRDIRASSSRCFRSGLHQGIAPAGADKPRPYMLCGLILAAVASAAPYVHAELQPGDPIPMSVAGAEGVPATEGRVVLLDFWASWCAPCRASFPAFARLHDEFAERGLVIVAVGIDDRESAHEAFLRKTKPPFFTMRDASKAIVAEVGPPAMPTSYLFGRDGRLRNIHTGFHGKQTEAELRAQLEALLGEEG